MTIEPGQSILVLFAFPPSQSGRLAEFFYTIKNADGSVYLTRRQDNAVDFLDGSYGVLLSFPYEGQYQANGELDGTRYKASEEINVKTAGTVVSYDSFGK